MVTQHNNTRTITPQANYPMHIGNEDPNPVGISTIHDYISNTNDRILHHTTFDFGTKVMALTLQGIILVDTGETDADDNPSVASATYGELLGVEGTGHDREIKLKFRDGEEATFRMGNAQTATQLKNLITTYQSNFLSHGDPRLWTADDDDYDEVDNNPDIEAPGIAERVRFWEEQDRINQALIPRVIRQSELLTKHVAEHDDLPQLVSRVVADALAEQAKQYDAALAGATEQLNSAHGEALQAANAELEKRYESAVAKVQQEARRTRNRLTAVSAGAVAVAVAAVIIAVLV